MRRVSRELGFEARNAAQRRFRPKGAVMEDNDSQMNFLGRKFLRGEEFGESSSPNRRDMEDNLKWIRDARPWRTGFSWRFTAMRTGRAWTIRRSSCKLSRARASRRGRTDSWGMGLMSPGA